MVVKQSMYSQTTLAYPHMLYPLLFKSPGEAMWAKMVVKAPGLDMAAEMSELDLSYGERWVRCLGRIQYACLYW